MSTTIHPKQLRALVVLVSGFFLISCSKEDVDSIASRLHRYTWHEYHKREVRYRATASGYEQIRDTSYFFLPCTQQSGFRFQRDSVVTFKNACIANDSEERGKWYLEENKHLVVAIPFVVDNQTRIFGMDGYIIDSDDAHFDLKSTRIMAYYNCNNTNPCEFIKDSIVTVVTYRS